MNSALGSLGALLPPPRPGERMAVSEALKALPRAPLRRVLSEEAALPQEGPSKLWMLGVVMVAGGVGFYRGWSGA